MKCKKCGTVFEVGVFCPECGTRNEAEISPEEQAKKQEEERIAKEKNEREEKEKRELELARQKTEQERIAKERAEKEAEAEKAKLELARLEKEKREKKKGSAMETVALVFGIISLVTCGSGIVPGVIALVCALQCKENGEIPSRAKTGMTCGMIGLIVFGILFLLMLVMALIGE